MDFELTAFGEILLFIIGGASFALLMLLVSYIFRPQRPNFEKNTSYECGEEPIGNAWGQFNMRFYIAALVFLLFEVELIFLFPWAVVFGQKALVEATNGTWAIFAIIEMFIFVGVLALGLIYVWAKGYLDWEKPEMVLPEYKSPVPKEAYEAFNERVVDSSVNSN